MDISVISNSPLWDKKVPHLPSLKTPWWSSGCFWSSSRQLCGSCQLLNDANCSPIQTEWSSKVENHFSLPMSMLTTLYPQQLVIELAFSLFFFLMCFVKLSTKCSKSKFRINYILFPTVHYFNVNFSWCKNRKYCLMWFL